MVVAERKILAIVKDKPYFIQGNFVLYLGDCLRILAQLPENSVDMIFADPPYNLSNGGFSVHAGRMVSVNKGIWDVSKGFEGDYDFHYKWLEASRRVLKPEGTLWVSGTYHSIYQCGHALQSLGYHILNDIAWFKPNASPNLSCRFFTASHETIIWARKEKKTKHTFNYDLMKNGEWPEDQLKKAGLQMRSVWSMGTPKPPEKKYGKHPTQKPLDLLRRIVLASTNKNDVILDPFTGSSTTGIAAAMFDRKFVGIDMESKYLELSKKRFSDIKKSSAKDTQNIPAFVCTWTDEYFHKSASDVPIRFPRLEIIKYLAKFKKDSKVKLYRGVNKYNKENDLITSWTYDKKIAEGYILKDGGKIVEKEFLPKDILLDTTLLGSDHKKILGYDYKIDDKEVLIINSKK
jgi:site-specific DNA-methyltransferase (adenine-specific)